MNKKKLIWCAAPIFLLGPLLLLGIYNLAFNGGGNNLLSDSTRGSDNFSNELASLDGQNKLTFNTTSTPTLSVAVRNLPSHDISIQPELLREINPRTSHFIPPADQENSFFQDDQPIRFDFEAQQIMLSPQLSVTGVFTQVIQSFEGAGFSGVNPPDPVGAIGQDYYIQMINGGAGALFSIYDREGFLIQGPTLLESLGSGNCANGAGDPIVLYDQLANRWFMSEFNTASSQYPLCHYVSQTADPLGSWYAYEFNMPNFPDYPKYGLWPTAYVGTSNETAGLSVPAVYAFDRQKMLSGEPASYIRFEAPRLSGFGFQALTPADLEGSLQPSSNSPALFMRHRDDESHNSNSSGSADFLEIWSLTPDFETPSNSSFQKIADISVPEFDSAMCGLNNFSCVPQPSTSVRLDPIREVIMQRLQYMNHQSHESIVGNLVTDLNGNNQHAIFWFELRRINGSAWKLYQSGSFGDTIDHRWMGSIGMDINQNIGMVYNVSGANTFPSLRYTGRLATQPLGTLLREEGTIAEGAAANSSTRYGDYSSVTLDPKDGCTFWATGQYNPAASWSTRIAAFKFPSCKSTPQFFLADPSTNLEFLVNNSIELPFLISASDSFTETVSISASIVSSSTPINVQPTQLIPTSTQVTITAQTDPLPTGEYSMILKAESASQAISKTVAFSVVPTLTVGTTLTEPQNGQRLVTLNPTLSWIAVAGATSYRVEISTSPNFETLIQDAVSVAGTSYSSPISLVEDQIYFWRVRPENNFSQGASVTAEFRTKPAAGLCQASAQPVVTLATGFESGLGAWSTEGTNGSWSTSSNQVFEDSFSGMASSPGIASTQKLVSPEFTLSPTADSRWLSFALWRDLEGTTTFCNDGLILEIEDDGVWQPIEASSIISNPYNSPIVLGSDNVLEGQPAWCGAQDWTQSLVDFTAFSGPLRLRWHLATDRSVGREGVYIDAVEIYECNPQNLTYYLPVFAKDAVYR